MNVANQQRRTVTLLTYICVALVALLPRVLQLGQFLTVDEANFWLARSELFLNALRSGNAIATAISTHPGVTTMWSGAIGILLRRPLIESGLIRDLSVPEAIALMRLPLALAHASAVVGGYALLRRMLPAGAALLGALLWACDPFAVAYSRLLHVDAPLMTFTTMSLLAACTAWHTSTNHQRGLVVCSGISAGLAMLSKSPSLLLPPLIGMIALAAWRWPPAPEASTAISAKPARRYFVDLIIWALSATVIMLILWPALWVGPLKIYQQLRLGIEGEGAQPHMLGNFFLGRADDAPGMLFYPVALALRLTPWALLGLLLVPLIWRELPPSTRRSVAVLALFAITFTLAMSLFPKKFNRYLLPVFPSLDIIAGLGIWYAASWAAKKYRFAWLAPAIGSAIALVAALNIAWWHPYAIVSFNQLLGCAPTGARTFVAGWGEGFDLVAAWLNQQPDITGVSTISRFPIVQNPYMRAGANAEAPRSGSLTAAAGYIVVYLEQVQRGDLSPPFNQFYQRAIPLHTVTIKGVDYAWIYQVPPALAHEQQASFGTAIQLRGFETSTQPQPNQGLTISLGWAVLSQPGINASLFVHLMNQSGQRVAQVDLPLPTKNWQPGRYPQTSLPLPLPTNLAPGNYHVVIGLYDPATGQRLPLTSPQAADPSISGDNALLLTTITVR